MAKTIRVSGALVRKYATHSAVCSSWRSDIRGKFDLYSAEQFDVPVDYLRKAIESAPTSSLKRELEADFGEAIKAAQTVDFSQKAALLENGKVMTGIQIAGASARNSLLPEAAGRAIFLDGECDYLIRETKKGNYLIVPVEPGSAVPAKFKLLSNVTV